MSEQDEQSNSEEVDQTDDTQNTDDQSTETQDASQQTEQLDGQDSESFTNVDRDTLSPELQATYDNMNRAFTQGMQGLAEERRSLEERRDYAAVGELVENNSELNRLVWDGINRLKSGQPLGATQQSSQQRTTEQPPERTPEEAAGRNMIREEVAAAFKEGMAEYMQPFQQVTSYMNQNQARTEYEVLCGKYPAAKTITPTELQTMQLRYNKADGASISLEEAFTMMAMRRPELLSTQTDQSSLDSKTSQTKQPAKKRPASVAGGAQRGGTESLAPGTPGFQKLRDIAKQLTKDGVGGVSNAMARAAEKVRQHTP